MEEGEGGESEVTGWDGVDLTAGLGPKVANWRRAPPAPVDADQLLVPGVTFAVPYRLLPYGLNPKLTNDEMTAMRRMARRMPPHFMLGLP